MVKLSDDHLLELVELVSVRYDVQIDVRTLLLLNRFLAAEIRRIQKLKEESKNASMVIREVKILIRTRRLPEAGKN